MQLFAKAAGDQPQERGCCRSLRLWVEAKGKLLAGIQGVSVPLPFLHSWTAIALYIAIALLWFTPEWRNKTAF